MLNLRYFLSALGMLILLGCNDSVEENSTAHLSTGNWILEMDIGDDVIPIRMNLTDDNKVIIVNASEQIIIDDPIITADSIIFKMPRFNSEFVASIKSNSTINGTWHNHLKTDYSLPFHGFHLDDNALEAFDFVQPDKYEVWFSPGTPDEYKAIGLFEQQGETLYGTFLTETGDYRFLEGQKAGNRLSLSCFDGSHLFLFHADQHADSITNGVFRSGKHWSEPWVAVRNEDFALTHPDSLTHTINEELSLSFVARNTAGDSIYFGPDQYMDHVTIVQIFGSWCPNCYDENVFYKELHNDYESLGLRIIPVAFERSEDINEQAKSVKTQFDRIGLDYDFYLGGKASKKVASEVFSDLNQIISFPTSIYLDRKGQIRKIHTGFYGPGTGNYHEEYVTSTRQFIEELLNEDVTESAYLSSLR